MIKPIKYWGELYNSAKLGASLSESEFAGSFACNMLIKLARFSVRHRRLVVGIWVLLVVAVGAISNTLGTNFATVFEIPASESSDVQKLLEANNSNRAGFSGQIVFASPTGVTTDAIKSNMSALFDEVTKLDGVNVTSPFETRGQINQDGTTAFAAVDVSMRSQAAIIELGEDIRAIGDKYTMDGLQIEYGGEVFAGFEFPASEVYGLLAAIIILILAFGSVLAMGLPIGTAILGLGLGTSVVGLVSNIIDMPDFTTSLVAMIGLGVGIDYALFIVTRYRECLVDGLSVEESVVEAVDTSGRAVIFAGITVIISLLGLLVMGLSFARGLAIGAAIGVAFMIVASITFLPALLAIMKHRIDVTTRAALIAIVVFVLGAFISIVNESSTTFFGSLGASVLVMLLSFVFKPLRQPIKQRPKKAKELTFWYRWSRYIQRRPLSAVIGASAVLLVLTAPLASIRLGFGDNGNAPEDTTVRKAYDMIAAGFGPGFNGPLYITVQGDTAAKPEKLQIFVDTISSTTGVAYAQALPISNDGSLALVVAYPKTAPQDEATSDLVKFLRTEVVPVTGVDAKIGGFTASGTDFADVITSRLPYLFIGVLSLSFLLLMAVFRSLLVPLKAVIMNLLSIGSAYGVLVAIFQWGWGISLIGVGKAGPIEAWAPMMLFAIVFGLSMDYEVFLLSRIKEEYDHSGDNATAVADGLAATARVITAAALIMVFVFGAFVTGFDRQLKLFGLGLSVAVFVDATIVRMVLVPATMELLGDRNWWLPAWINKLLPKIDVEGHHHTTTN